MANDKKSVNKKNNNKNSSKKKAVNGKYNFSKIALIVFLVICALTIGVGMLFKSPIEKLLNGQTDAQTNQNAVIDDNGLSIHFVDVGQGDCIAIKFPDGKTMLIDAGPADGITKMINYLNNKFFGTDDKVFDYLLLTHSDADHCGGMVKICQEYQINKIYRPMVYYNYNSEMEYNTQSSPKYCTTAVYYRTIKAFIAETTDIVETNLTNCNGTEKIQGEGYYFDFYSPRHFTTSVSMNDFSPIMVLNYNSKKLMFTGDATSSGTENEIIDEMPEVDLLKVGHHGSRYSTSENFLEKINPSIAVIQCGAGNKYGHPHSETMTRLNNLGTKVYRNDQNGNIIANVTSQNAQINIFVDSNSVTYVVRVEYIICGVILISAYFCFGIKPKKTNKK